MKEWGVRAGSWSQGYVVFCKSPVPAFFSFSSMEAYFKKTSVTFRYPRNQMAFISLSLISSINLIVQLRKAWFLQGYRGVLLFTAFHTHMHPLSCQGLCSAGDPVLNTREIWKMCPCKSRHIQIGLETFPSILWAKGVPGVLLRASTVHRLSLCHILNGFDWQQEACVSLFRQRLH